MSHRHAVVGVTAIAALLMYIDRVCISILADPIQTDLKLTDEQKADMLGAFFLTYALFQIPVGALADRFGPRIVLALCIAGWSAVTAATGLVWSLPALVGVRLLLGVAEAGAYPAAAGLVKRWARPEERGRFSSAVALGGRVGGAFAPWMTSALGLALVGVSVGGYAVGASGVHWRAVFVLYGLVGLVVAVVFWLTVRDDPPGHVPPPATVRPHILRRLGRIATTRGMWLFGVLQFCNNISWAFLVTLLPTFLKDAGVPQAERSQIQTGVLLAGCVGMIVGGYATDAIHKKLGARWGRSIPIAVMMLACAGMCGVVSLSPGLWVAVGALAVMAFCQDLGIPSVWAYAQDVGGKDVGSALGWGNMLGNLGAALSPVLLIRVKAAGGWDAAFALCAGCYVVAAGCGLMLDASKPLEDGEPPA